jgi:DNA-directed RNA polymerase delta subunit
MTQLEKLIEQGYASTAELLDAGVKHMIDLGVNDWGLRERVAIDSENNQWDWMAEDQYWEKREDGVEFKYQYLTR